MKISAQWIKDNLGLNLDTAKMAEQLTLAGIEVSSVEPAAPKFSQVVIGEVLEVNPHPNAEKLHLCLVNAGSHPLQIVCGAANVRAGMKVAVALVGAHLGDLEIKKAKLRGIESHGMLCSAKELGLAEISEGIMELPRDAEVGMGLRAYLDLDDEILEIEITPNRGDCLSVLGLVRELAALNRVKPKIIEAPKVKGRDSSIAVEVLAQDFCPRYVGCVIRDIKINAPTPIYIQERLRRSGMRSINAVIDAANYVMLELGQPLHIFDLKKITGNINVRLAEDQEQLVLLNGKTVTLNRDTLVIADQKKVLAIAGIMGGNNSVVDESTTDIFIESAFFAPGKLRGIARRYGLQTDASFRFERGVDAELQMLALQRTVVLLLTLVGGKTERVVECVASEHLPKVATILIRKQRIAKVLGIEIPNHQVKEILAGLGMKVKSRNFGWKVQPPTFRFDLAIEEDLIEELARIFGYHNIPEQKIFGELQINSLTSFGWRQLGDFLVSRGYREIITPSFINPKLQELFGDTSLVLANPISPELSVMRSDIWAGLFNVLCYNQSRQHPRMKLFEVGLCFNQGDELQQIPFLGGLVTDSYYPEQWGMKTVKVDFFDVKNDVEHLLGILDQKIVNFIPSDYKILHPKRSSKILINNQCIGYIGELHPEIKQKLDISYNACLFSINLSLLNNKIHGFFKPIDKVPGVIRDIAIIIDKNISWKDLSNEIAIIGGKLLKNIEVFDIYMDESLGKDRISIAIHLTFQHSSTLTEVEVENEVGKMVFALEKKFNAKLRG